MSAFTSKQASERSNKQVANSNLLDDSNPIDDRAIQLTTEQSTMGDSVYTIASNGSSSGDGYQKPRAAPLYFDPAFMSCNRPKPKFFEASAMTMAATAAPVARPRKSAVKAASNSTDEEGSTDEEAAPKDGPELFQGFTTVKPKKRVQLGARPSMAELHPRTLMYRFLLCLPDGPGNKDYNDGAGAAHRKLREAITVLGDMLKTKNSKMKEVLVYPWAASVTKAGDSLKPRGLAEMTSWDEYKGKYVHEPSNVRYATQVWLRVYIGVDLKAGSSNRDPHTLAKNWADKYKKVTTTKLTVSADVLQTEHTQNIGYFYGLKTDSAFDTEVFNKAIRKAIGIPVSIHMGNVGFIDSNGKILLHASEKQVSTFGKKDTTMEYQAIRAFHVEVEDNITSLASQRLSAMFNVNRPEHVYPMQIRMPFVPTGAANPASKETLVKFAERHLQLVQDTQSSADIHHILDLDKLLVFGTPLTLRRILMDILAADPDGSPRPFLLDQVNTTNLGYTRFVFHKSQLDRVTSILPYLYSLIKTFASDITTHLGLTEQEQEEFDHSLETCFTVSHVEANSSVRFNQATGIFSAPADDNIQNLAAMLGKKGTKKDHMDISFDGDASVNSALSQFTSGGVSTTSAATKMRLAHAETRNDQLEQELKELAAQQQEALQAAMAQQSADMERKFADLLASMAANPNPPLAAAADAFTHEAPGNAMSPTTVPPTSQGLQPPDLPTTQDTELSQASEASQRPTLNEVIQKRTVRDQERAHNKAQAKARGRSPSHASLGRRQNSNTGDKTVAHRRGRIGSIKPVRPRHRSSSAQSRSSRADSAGSKGSVSTMDKAESLVSQDGNVNSSFQSLEESAISSIGSGWNLPPLEEVTFEVDKSMETKTCEDSTGTTTAGPGELEPAEWPSLTGDQSMETKMSKDSTGKVTDGLGGQEVKPWPRPTRITTATTTTTKLPSAPSAGSQSTGPAKYS